MRHSDFVAEFPNLLTAAKLGDREALGRLLKHFEPLLLASAQTRLPHLFRPKLDADDIVQETFYQAVRAVQRFHGNSVPQFEAWLRRMLALVQSKQVRGFRCGIRDLRQESSPSLAPVE
jgi:DNA-directed RNA polymerase specialized sigma24 family protein